MDTTPETLSRKLAEFQERGTEQSGQRNIRFIGAEVLREV